MATELDQPQTQDGPKLDLAKAIFDKIEELGPEKAAEYFKRPVATIKKWQGSTLQPDVGAAQRVLDEMLATEKVIFPLFDKPPEQGRTIPEPFENGAEPERKTTLGGDTSGPIVGLDEPRPKAKVEPKKFSILTPINRDMSYAVVLSLLGNWKATLPEEVRAQLSVMDFEPDTVIHNGRNRLAMRFLASGNEWSYWMDSDVIAPIGNPAWFKRRTGTKYPDKWFGMAAIQRLTTRGKTIVSAVYSQRSHGGTVIAQPGLAPASPDDTAKMEKLKQEGPRDELMPVKWAGFGCIAVHRKVFEDILEKVPGVRAENEGEAHNFFSAMEDGPQGEDIAFCKRAFQAGHQTFLDLSVFCGHIGKFAFMP